METYLPMPDPARSRIPAMRASHTGCHDMVKDAEEQIHLITNARDIWDLREPSMDTVGYMCSDHDGNGRQEILVAKSCRNGRPT